VTPMLGRCEKSQDKLKDPTTNDLTLPLDFPEAALEAARMVRLSRSTAQPAVFFSSQKQSNQEASMTEEGRVQKPLKNNIFLSTLNFVYNWGRRGSVWPLSFGLACCTFEAFAAGDPRFDVARFGMEVARASPRQADLMIVAGTVTKKMLPQIVRLYNQMAEPKYVIAMGACAIGGGPFKEGYNVVSGIDKFLPVDVYLPGCPPRPEAFIHGIMLLHEKVMSQDFRQVRWYQKEPIPDIPIPTLGPDLVDVRHVPQIKEQVASREGNSE
jgi:NADH-quinone oxidoreductase subunit B